MCQVEKLQIQEIKKMSGLRLQLGRQCILLRHLLLLFLHCHQNKMTIQFFQAMYYIN